MAHRDIRQHRNPLIRSILLGVGWLAVVLGVVGIFLPVLPMLKAVLAAFETRRRRPKLLRNDDDDDDDDAGHIIMLPGTLRRRVQSEIEEL